MRVRALAALKEGSYRQAAAEAEAGLAIALEHHSALLAAECAAAAAVAYRRLGNLELAARHRADSLAGLQHLGAMQLLDRLEKEWSETA